MHVKAFYMGYYIVNERFQEPQSVSAVEMFVMQDGVTIRIRKMVAIKEMLLIFYDDILPNQSPADRFADLDV
jgi:predicted NAD-dependent protein-ADP-ribosyltransferase YbiA (DUF1768 family)